MSTITPNTRYRHTNCREEFGKLERITSSVSEIKASLLVLVSLSEAKLFDSRKS